MNPEYMKIGMKVIIHEDISQTEAHYGLNSDMKSMRSHEYTIKSIIEKRHGDAASINGYTWHAEDFHPIEYKEKDPQPFHFNVEELRL